MSGESSRKRARTKNPARRSRPTPRVGSTHATTPASLLIDGVQCFRSTKTVALWPKFTKKKIEFGRHVATPLFAGYALYHRFRALEWEGMINLDYPCYPDMVRAFYCNLETTGIGSDLRITSLVAGHDVSFGISELAEILELPNEGELRYMAPRDPIIFTEEEIAEMHLPLMPNYENTWKITEQQLRPVPRLISRIIQHNIYPRGGERDKQRLFQTYLTYCVFTGTVVNLPYIIMMHMIHHFSVKGPQVLPYGILLTRIFEHFGVRFDLQGPLRTPAEETEYKPITCVTIKHMGLPTMIEDIEDPAAEAHIPDPAPAAPAVVHEPLHPDLLAFMTEVRQAQRTQMKELRHVKKQLAALMLHSNIPAVSESDDGEDMVSAHSEEDASAED